MSFYEEQRDKKLIRALNDIVKELHGVRSSIDALRESAILLGKAPEKQVETVELNNDIEDSVETTGWTCRYDPVDNTTEIVCENCHTRSAMMGKFSRLPLFNCYVCGKAFDQTNTELFR